MLPEEAAPQPASAAPSKRAGSLKRANQATVRLARPRPVSRTSDLAFLAGGVGAAFLIPLVLLVWVHEESVQIAVLAGLMASTVALLLTEHFRFYNRTPKLARLETALENKQTFSYLDRILTYEEQIERVVQCAGPGRDFFLQRVTELREAAKWADLAAGQVRLTVEEEFPARLRFVELSQREVVGVSFDEARFWRSPAGRNYLDLQKEEIESRGLSITRIFVGSPDEVASWVDIFHTQDACGIEVLVLDPASRLETDDEDFNIYDGQVVRYAGAMDPDADVSAAARQATFSVRQGDVRRYTSRITSLRSRSTSYRELLDQLETSEQGSD